MTTLQGTPLSEIRWLHDGNCTWRGRDPADGAWYLARYIGDGRATVKVDTGGWTPLGEVNVSEVTR